MAKELFYANGGVAPIGRSLYFDTDCMEYLERKWLLSKKTIYINSPYFFFTDTKITNLTPLNKTDKRGTSASKWQQAYQAVKHNRIHNLKKGNVLNLINALGALYILNIYYREAQFESVADKDASNIDWGLGSAIFSVKVSHEDGGASNDKIYEKKADYDECIYLVKHTDDSAKYFMDIMNGVKKQVNELILNETMQSINEKIKLGEIVALDDIKAMTASLIEEKKNTAMMQIVEKEKRSIHNAIQGLRFEAVLNKQQF